MLNKELTIMIMDISGVYFLFFEGNNNRCKIGSSKNCATRLKSHKTTTPWCYYYKVIKTDDYRPLEKELHDEYSDSRFAGEWFNLNKGQIDEIIADRGYGGNLICSLSSLDSDDIQSEEVPTPSEKNNSTVEIEQQTQFQCEKCGQKFKEERYLKRHQNKTIPCDKDIRCHKCNKKFKRQGHLTAHLNRKTPCAPEEIPVIEPNNPENRCQFCNRTYSTKGSLTRHQKTCDKDKNMGIMMQMMQEMKEQNDQMKEKIDKLEGGQITIVQNIDQRSVNVTNNLYVNVSL